MDVENCCKYKEISGLLKNWVSFSLQAVYPQESPEWRRLWGTAVLEGHSPCYTVKLLWRLFYQVQAELHNNQHFETNDLWEVAQRAYEPLKREIIRVSNTFWVNSYATLRSFHQNTAEILCSSYQSQMSCMARKTAALSTLEGWTQHPSSPKHPSGCGMSPGFPVEV